MADRRREDVVGAADVPEERAERRGDDQLNADGRGEVKGGVGGGHEVADQLGVEGGAFDDLYTGHALEMLDRLSPPCREVVEQDQSLSPRQQGIRQVRPDET